MKRACFYYLVLALCLASCRAGRFCEKKILRDSIFTHDTILQKAVQTTTEQNFARVDSFCFTRHDTVFVVKRKTESKTRFVTIRDTVRVAASKGKTSLRIANKSETRKTGGSRRLASFLLGALAAVLLVMGANALFFHKR